MRFIPPSLEGFKSENPSGFELGNASIGKRFRPKEALRRLKDFSKVTPRRRDKSYPL